MMIPPKVATLAALAEVARQRQESVSWKEDAAWVRDLAKKMNESPLQRGPKDQKRLQELFEGVSDIFNRSKPAGLEEPPAEDSFAESAELRSLMKRMEEAEKTLKTEIGSADALASKKTMAQHEAAILAVLAKIATDKGYGYDDDEFRGYGNAVVEAAQAIRTSTEGGDFSGFEAAMSKVATSCQNCHSKYKND
jgi:cytochrome c556